MSHHLISKKIWISAAVLTIMFLGLTYAWFYYTNQLLLQTEIAERKENQSVAPSESAAEVAQPMIEPIETKEPVLSFPCTLRMKDGAIGLYDENGSLCQEMKQIGEYLSDQDRIQLIQGIQAENEQELIALCESFHLQ